MKLADFMNYNTAFTGHQTAMPNPFLGGDGLVKYDDATPPTIDNYARDVVAFLSWVADPSLEERSAWACSSSATCWSPPCCSASPSAASGAPSTDAGGAAVGRNRRQPYCAVTTGGSAQYGFAYCALL